VPASNRLAQARPQRIPFGSELTAPDPTTATSSVTRRTNVALTLRAWLMVTVHAPELVHAPLQPVKREPVAAVAVNPTTMPSS
jgi:hypothetical protein